jgi:hypothetical protein
VRQQIYWPLNVILALAIAGCSSVPPRIEAVPGENQSVSYDRGQVKLASEENHLLGLTIVDYADEKVIIGVSVSNNGDEPLNFSEDNVTGELVSGDEALPVDVHRYDSVAKDLDIEENEALKQAGIASIGVGSAFVPFGGIAVSAARLLLSLGQLGAASDEKDVDKETASQLAQVYLRRHTLFPGTNYEGLLLIGLPDELEDGDSLVFTVAADEETQKFNFLCRRKAE